MRGHYHKKTTGIGPVLREFAKDPSDLTRRDYEEILSSLRLSQPTHLEFLDPTELFGIQNLTFESMPEDKVRITVIFEMAPPPVARKVFEKTNDLPDDYTLTDRNFAEALVSIFPDIMQGFFPRAGYQIADRMPENVNQLMQLTDLAIDRAENLSVHHQMELRTALGLEKLKYSQFWKDADKFLQEARNYLRPSHKDVTPEYLVEGSILEFIHEREDPELALWLADSVVGMLLLIEYENLGDYPRLPIKYESLSHFGDYRELFKHIANIYGSTIQNAFEGDEDAIHELPGLKMELETESKYDVPERLEFVIKNVGLLMEAIYDNSEEIAAEVVVNFFEELAYPQRKLAWAVLWQQTQQKRNS